VMEPVHRDGRVGQHLAAFDFRDHQGVTIEIRLEPDAECVLLERPVPARVGLLRNDGLGEKHESRRDERKLPLAHTVFCHHIIHLAE
jgi:hypothetical protein